ncbi:MAG: ATP synthase F1 subunit gamma [Candidatus Omnitrophica bacterium]|nr:ATP synthase F1 subunit gamma [Candidatus Omnitrophota bacterium]
MAQSIRQIKNRIRSIQNTEKVTSAMQMISFTKLNRIDNYLFAARPYFTKLESLLNNLISSSENFLSPYLEKRLLKKKIVLCVITSDNGLCGIYNNNIIRLAEDFINSYGKGRIDLVVVGRRGYNYFKKRGINIINSFIGINAKFSDKISNEITNYLINIFLSRQADEVYIAYTFYENTLTQRPVLRKYLELEHEAGRRIDYIFETGTEKILDKLITSYMSMKMKVVLLESITSELAARSFAMKAATDNARDLLKGLILLRNKQRQANITREMLEIISSAEALKG